MTASRFVRRDLRDAALPWAAARVLVLGSLWMSRFLADKLPASVHTRATDAGLFAYDGSWYRGIAAHGYAGSPREGLRFFPLYPLLGRWLGTVFLDHRAAALVVIANASALVLGGLVVRLVRTETGDDAAACRAAWFIALLPPAVSLVLAYAEPLMMVAAAGTFLGLRSRRWWAAGALGVIAGLTRPLGILLVIPAAIEATRGWSTTKARERVARATAVAAPAVGTAIYLTWVGAVYGDPLEPFNVQSRVDLRGGSVDPVTHIVNAVKATANGDRFSSGLHLVWVAVFVALVVVLARRLPSSYAAYAGATLVLALTASNISSFDRYVFSTFAFAIGVALVTHRVDVNRVVLTVAAGGLVAYSTLAFFAAYVP